MYLDHHLTVLAQPKADHVDDKRRANLGLCGKHRPHALEGLNYLRMKAY